MQNTDIINMNDSGYDIVVRFVYNGKVFDISTFQSGKIILTSPSGIEKSYPANLYTDGTDGKIFYTVQGNEFNESGVWEIKAQVTTQNGTRTTDQRTFVVV